MSSLVKYPKTMLQKSRFVTALWFLLLFVSLVPRAEGFMEVIHFDKESYEPGESGVFYVDITSSPSDPTLYFTQLEIFFDWGNYWTSGVIVVNPGGRETISVRFSVPSSVSAGSHSYYYKLTWSLTASLQNLKTSTSSSLTITIKEKGFVFRWEFMVLIVAVSIGIVIGVFVSKSKEQKERKK